MRTRGWRLLSFLALGLAWLLATSLQPGEARDLEAGPAQEDMMSRKDEIILAGGCFWGVEGYFQELDGILATEAVYVNGRTEETSYEELKETDHAEAVRLVYDRHRLGLVEILQHYLRIIDPTSLNRQGNDQGRQYRTGIYYKKEEDRVLAQKVLALAQEAYDRPLVVELEPVRNLIPAEAYHQAYLAKNPGGYCHIPLALAQEPLYEEDRFKSLSQEDLREQLSPLAYEVTQEQGTERPFSSPYQQPGAKGLYVDVTSGQPLFLSIHQYDAGCGWPSFTKAIVSTAVDYRRDDSLARSRVEVVAGQSQAHLGHVFEDGPQDQGGRRYCINGAALDFIPYEDLEARGYGDFKIYFEEE